MSYYYAVHNILYAGFREKVSTTRLLHQSRCVRSIPTDIERFAFSILFPILSDRFIFYFPFRSTPDIIYDPTTRVWRLLTFHQ